MKAKYKVTTPFGLRSKGTILDCFILNRDGQDALVYHPPNRRHGECGCFEICRLNKDSQYESISDKHYINQSYRDDMAEGFPKYLKTLK